MSNPSEMIIEIKDISGFGVIDLRVLPDDAPAISEIEAALGINLPTLPRTANYGDDVCAMWFSIDQWLITMPFDKLAGVKDKLDTIAADKFVSVVDVSDLRSVLELKGDKVREVLAKSASTDFHNNDYKPGLVRRLSIAEQGAAIHVLETSPDKVHVYVFRSYIEYVTEWLTMAAHKDRALDVTLV